MAARTPKRSSTSSRDSIKSPSTPTSPAGNPFSPVAASPVRSPYANNLQGVPRKVRDGAVSWHDYINKWRSCVKEGKPYLSQVFQIRAQALHSDNTENDEDGSEGKAPSILERTFPAPIEDHTEALTNIIEKMKTIVAKMEKLTQQLENLSELDEASTDASEPLFKTWRTPDFYEASAEVLAMYKQEVRLKETIVQNAAHTTDKDLAVTMQAAWIYDPYIDDRARFLIEGFLQEAGHREPEHKGSGR